MKTTLIVIQNEADHADAKGLVEKLMGSSDPQDGARWPRTAPAVPVLLSYLMDQHGLSRADLVPLLGTSSRVSGVLTGNRRGEAERTLNDCSMNLEVGWPSSISPRVRYDLLPG